MEMLTLEEVVGECEKMKEDDLCRFDGQPCWGMDNINNCPLPILSPKTDKTFKVLLTTNKRD
jgi:hypothetical protein